MGDVVKTVATSAEQVFGGVTNVLSGGGQRTLDMFGNATGFNQFDPNFYGIDRSAFDPSGMETAQTERLQQRALGEGGPSPAELQLMAGLDRTRQQASGMAASQRGVSPALAARLAQQFGAQAGTQTNQQAALLRAQEQMGAEQSLAQALQSQRQGRMQREALASGQSLGEARIGGDIAESAADRQAQTFRAIGQGVASGFSEGGQVPSYQLGGAVMPQQLQAADQAFLSGFANQLGQMAAYQMPVQKQKKEQDPAGGSDLAKQLVEKFMGAGSGTPMTAGEVGASSPMPGTMVVNKGAKVVLGTAVKPGDHPANDTVPAMLSPGEIVVPRTVAKMSPQKIAEFVKAIQKQGQGNV